MPQVLLKELPRLHLTVSSARRLFTENIDKCCYLLATLAASTCYLERTQIFIKSVETDRQVQLQPQLDLHI